MFSGTELILSPFIISGIVYVMVSLTAPVDVGVAGSGGSSYSQSLSLCHLDMAVDFFIRCESPELVIVGGNKAMALYCVSSTHAATEYVWRMFGESKKKYPSTRIIFINKAGLYQCSMKYNGTEIKGKVLTVRVDIGSSSDSDMGMQLTEHSHFFIVRNFALLEPPGSRQGVYTYMVVNFLHKLNVHFRSKAFSPNKTRYDHNVKCG